MLNKMLECREGCMHEATACKKIYGELKSFNNPLSGWHLGAYLALDMIARQIDELTEPDKYHDGKALLYISYLRTTSNLYEGFSEQAASHDVFLSKLYNAMAAEFKTVADKLGI